MVSVSALTFVEAADGSIGDFRLSLWHRQEYSEPDILANVERVLAGPVADGGRVATFNGVGHDLHTLRMRQVRSCMCEADAVAQQRVGDSEHMDVSLAGPGAVRPRTVVPYET